MHDLFVFEQTGVDENKMAQGHLQGHGPAPNCLERLAAPRPVSRHGLFERRVLEPRPARLHPQQACGDGSKTHQSDDVRGSGLAVIGVFSVLSDLVLRKKARIKDRIRELGVGADGPGAEVGFSEGPETRCSRRRRNVRPCSGSGSSAMVAQSGLAGGPRANPPDCRHRRLCWGRAGYHVDAALAAGPAGRRSGASPLRCCTSRSVRQARIHALAMQLPEAFELMSRAVRAGQTMSGAM